MKAPSVLVVDDDDALLALLRLRLEAAGFTVETVSSGEAALGWLASHRPDVVLTDMQMDGLDGMALFRTIRERDASLPVVMLTAHATVPDAVAATQEGVFGYLAKPYDGQELTELLTRAVALAPAAGESDDWRAAILTASPAMEAVLAEARQVAQSEAAVLVQGESGTGKELLAQALHRAGRRARQPFVALNCGAIPPELLESELFGHVKGAFTGASRDHPGLFLAAHGGTLFLDEIGDMPLPLQVKLLRVLQEGEVRPVGALEARPVDVRVVSATHRDLDAAVADGTFREDLYYRLNVVNLVLPPLRERREDIPLLAGRFLAELVERGGTAARTFSPDALAALAAADWPGNVRQLRNVVEQCCALATTPAIPEALATRALRDKPTDPRPLAEARAAFERDYLVDLLKRTRGQVSEVARLAGRNRTEVYRLLSRHGLDPSHFKS